MTESQAELIIKPLPKKGMSADAIDSFFDEIEIKEPFGHFSRAFRATEDVQEVGKKAYLRFMSDNGFFSLYAPYMQQIEQEVIAMGVSLLHPEEDSTGNFVSGGTESNYSAMHAAKEWAKVHKPEVKHPNVVAPYTIHPSFQKGAKYLDMEVITTELDENGRGIAENIRNAINENTIMVAASAPSWHFARIDPIEEIAQVAQDHGLWMHVDGCIGTYISPFLEKLGRKLPTWDFRVPGVMSISGDLHKLGYCPKSASTIFWRHAELQQYHYVSIDDPFLGQYKLAGLAGSRTAGPIFAAWAVMNYLGEEGYLRMTRRLMELEERFKKEINDIEGLRTWDIDVTPMHFSSDKVPTEAIYQGLSEKGWIMLGLVNPPAITIPIDPSVSDEMVDHLVGDIKSVVEDLLGGDGPESGNIRYG